MVFHNFRHNVFYAECYGTDSGLSTSGPPDMRYDRLKQRYKGCTYVRGNLELTWHYGVNNNDLSFLSTIEVVTGYVLIVGVKIDTIPLLNLRLIRGDNTFPIRGVHYSLAVALFGHSNASDVSGLQELQMPSLQGEIFDKKSSNLDLHFTALDTHFSENTSSV